MLSRTADSLFWLARYMERAENMARLIDMGRRMGATPGNGPDCIAGRRSEWPSILAATGCTAGYNESRASEEYAALDEHIATCRYLLLDNSNFASVRSSFEAARFNARSTRAALTREMWEAVNDAWNYFRRVKPTDIRNGAVSPLLEMIKTAAAQFRGAAEGSALRNDGYEFLCLGFAVERLDCTARLLDVKAAPARRVSEAENGVIDRYRWIALLRAAGQLLAYRAHFRCDYDGALIDKFLISRTESPRSLLYSALQVEAHLTSLSLYYDAPAACLGEAQALTALIREAPIDSMDETQMHAFLSSVISANSRLAAAIAAAYHFGPAQDTESAEARAQADLLDDSDENPAAPQGQTQSSGHDGAVQSQASGDGGQVQQM